MQRSYFVPLSLTLLIGSYFQFTPASAQVTPDGTTSTTVNVNKNDLEINGGDTAGNNLFHSFKDFSVPNGGSAFFNNNSDIANIFSRVTGGNISNLDGLLKANGSANLFLINPAGIIFGEGARLDIGGSFYGSTADSILFPNGVEFSATNLNPPVLTINAPIGLGFRDNPGTIINRSIVKDNTGEDSIGLRVLEGRTLALIGGDVSIEGGLITVPKGRIELGSVGENSTVSLTPIEAGFDLGYQEVANYRDLSLSSAASVWTSDSSNADIEVRGGNISLSEGSQIGINPNFEGQAGDINIFASKSLTLDGNTADLDLESARIFSRVSGDSIGETSTININTPKLTLTNGAQIEGINDLGAVRGVDININVSQLSLEQPNSLIASQVYEEGTGDGGNITVNTDTLTLNDGAQINTITYGQGNGGDLIVNAAKSIELNGTVPDLEDNIPSGLLATVEIPLFPIPSAGNAGNITVNTPRLTVSNGAQIATSVQNNGNGGNLTLNVSDSILLTGTSPSAKLEGGGRSGIFVSAEPSYQEAITDLDTGESTLTGKIIPTTGNGGTLTLNAGNLIIEKGALISADTFSQGTGGNADIKVERLTLRDGGRISAGSLLGVEPLDTERGQGGNLNITATKSVEITGIGDINGEPVNSSIFTLAESNGNAGNTTLTTNRLNISDGGDINASANDLGTAGSISIQAEDLNLDSGKITAATNAGAGGNLDLKVADNLTLKNNSLISAAAIKDANGGNIAINSPDGFIIAFPNQNNDIIASAEQGQGGNIKITAQSVFGIVERPLNPITNDINASSEFGLDGSIEIITPDVDPFQETSEAPENVVEQDEVVAGVCDANQTAQDTMADTTNSFVINGKGGVPPTPVEPFSAETLIINGQSVIPNGEIEKKALQEQYPPIMTDQGPIYPARSIVKNPDGSIYLSAYPTDNTQRIPSNSVNCGI